MTAFFNRRWRGGPAVMFAIAALGLTPCAKAGPRLNPSAVHPQEPGDLSAGPVQLPIGTLPGCKTHSSNCYYVYPDHSWAQSGYTTLVIGGRGRQ